MESSMVKNYRSQTAGTAQRKPSFPHQVKMHLFSNYCTRKQEHFKYINKYK